jgi:membrane associated rhomboid family serine protease
MTSHAPTTAEKQSLDRLRLLILLAVTAVMIAVAAGALLLILEPTSGSTTEATLGVAAAIGGIASGVLVIASFIYAQVKNLWRLAPIGIRIVLWVFIAVGVGVTVWNLISQPSNA